MGQIPDYIPVSRDYGFLETEDILSETRRKLYDIYSQAETELKQAFDDYLKAFEKDRALRLSLVASGAMGSDDYKRWLQTRVMVGRHYAAVLQIASLNLASVNKIAYSVINGYIPEVYAVNYNFLTYTIENGLHISTDFTLYDRMSVERIVRENPDLLPRPEVDILRDTTYNKGKINSAVVQSIIQGENLDGLAERLEKVTGINYTSAVRTAATAYTAAQNSGRYDAILRAKKLGIDVDRRWIATLDTRTRDSHRHMNGRVAKGGQPFPNGLMYPGDHNGKPEEVYNCRCRVIAAFPGQGFSYKQQFSRLGDMSYTEWLFEHS